MHKQQTLEDIINMYPHKKFVLMGDNTQHDLTIYLETAEKFPASIHYIIIRKVIDRKEDNVLIEKHKEKLEISNTTLYYSDKFPHKFRLPD
jgi:phosphatidate phosphatase APP1